jgi:hypothetical protein
MCLWSSVMIVLADAIGLWLEETAAAGAQRATAVSYASAGETPTALGG